MRLSPSFHLNRPHPFHSRQRPGETPAGRYPLRNRATPDEVRTRKVPARGPVILTQGKPPPAKKAVDPLDALLREKRLADSRNQGEEARRQADNALAKKHMLDEMETNNSDDEATLRVSTDPFGLMTPPGDDSPVEEAEGARLLGNKRGKAVHNILEGDRKKEQVAMRYEQTLGVPLWRDDEEEAMDSDLSPPTFSSKSPMLEVFSDAISRQGAKLSNQHAFSC